MEKILDDYNLRDEFELEEIIQGVENSNYFLKGKKDTYILTIFEKRTNKEDIPFFMDLMYHLNSNNIPCPKPIKDKNGNIIKQIKNKPFIIISFLEGKSIINPENHHIKELGENLAKLHLASQNFTARRKNNLSITKWQSQYKKITEQHKSITNGLYEDIKEELDWIEKNWPNNLPTGVIHADLFPDNVFFLNDKLSGIIDFYFACTDFLIYDIAICINAWCFERDNELNVTKTKILLSSYNKVRKLSDHEFESIPVLASGAAMRFLLTRLEDWFINNSNDKLVKPKNPLELLGKNPLS